MFAKPTHQPAHVVTGHRVVEACLAEMELAVASGQLAPDNYRNQRRELVRFTSAWSVAAAEMGDFILTIRCRERGSRSRRLPPEGESHKRSRKIKNAWLPPLGGRSAATVALYA